MNTDLCTGVFTGGDLEPGVMHHFRPDSRDIAEMFGPEKPKSEETEGTEPTPTSPDSEEQAPAETDGEG